MPDGPSACMVTYIETLALTENDARRILVDYAGARAGEPGLRAIEVLQRRSIPGQFALVESGALAAVSAYDTAAARDAALAPLLIAPCDVRTHRVLSIGKDYTSDIPGNAVWVVTHIDVVPVHKDTGVERITRLADDSRGERGCLSIEAWQQVDRPNHMTLIEVWTDDGARDDHRVADDTRGFRDHLASASGALYDERVYARLTP